jgi:hypothetical protein
MGLLFEAWRDFIVHHRGIWPQNMVFIDAQFIAFGHWR